MLTSKHSQKPRGDDPGRALAVWSGLVRVARKIGWAGAERLGEWGLGPAQFELLRLIGAGKGSTQQDLADRLEVSRGNVSRLLGKLEDDGLVERVPEGAANRLRLTPNGEKLLARLVAEHDRFVHERFSGLTGGEQDLLLTLLRKLERSQGG